MKLYPKNIRIIGKYNKTKNSLQNKEQNRYFKKAITKNNFSQYKNKALNAPNETIQNEKYFIK